MGAVDSRSQACPPDPSPSCSRSMEGPSARFRCGTSARIRGSRSSGTLTPHNRVKDSFVCHAMPYRSGPVWYRQAHVLLLADNYRKAHQDPPIARSRRSVSDEAGLIAGTFGVQVLRNSRTLGQSKSIARAIDELTRLGKHDFLSVLDAEDRKSVV